MGRKWFSVFKWTINLSVANLLGQSMLIRCETLIRNSTYSLFIIFFFFVLVKRGDMLIVVLYSETYTKLSLFPSVWVISNLWKFHTYYFCDFCFLLKVVSNMFLICHFKDNVSWFVLNIPFMLKCKKYLHLSFFTFKDIFSFIFVLLTSRHWLCGINYFSE